MAEEVAHRNDTRIEKAARRANFPFVKTIEEFDFIFQSSLRLQQLGPYLGPELVTGGRTLILSGRPGLGKTHLAVAIGYRAIQNGFTARFVGASALIDELGKASRAGHLREAAAEWVAPDVLIVDEVGYLAHATDAANVLFGVVDQRYLHQKPLILTTNKKLKSWGEVLHDHDLAAVILDRVLERGAHMVLGGRSWRTKHIDPEILPDAGADPESPRRPLTSLGASEGRRAGRGAHLARPPAGPSTRRCSRHKPCLLQSSLRRPIRRVTFPEPPSFPDNSRHSFRTPHTRIKVARMLASCRVRSTTRIKVARMLASCRV